MSKYLALAIGGLALICGVLGWLLLDAHEDLGKARLAAEVNAATIKTMQANEDRNVEIDKRIESAIQKTATTTREVMRAINVSDDTGTCARSPAFSALGGLRRPPGDKDGGQGPAAKTPQPVPAPGR